MRPPPSAGLSVLLHTFVVRPTSGPAASRTTVGLRGEQGPSGHHGAAKQRRPCGHRCTRPCRPGPRVWRRPDRCLEVFAVDYSVDSHGRFGDHRPQVDDHVSSDHIDLGPAGSRAVMRARIDVARAAHETHSRMRQRKDHRYGHRLGLVGLGHRWAGDGHSARGIGEYPGDRGRIPRRRWHLSGRVDNSFPRRVGYLDHWRGDRSDDYSDDYSDDGWDLPGCGHTTGYWMGRGLSAFAV